MGLPHDVRATSRGVAYIPNVAQCALMGLLTGIHVSVGMFPIVEDGYQVCETDVTPSA
jgi:hypothetical protein